MVSMPPENTQRLVIHHCSNFLLSDILTMSTGQSASLMWLLSYPGKIWSPQMPLTPSMRMKLGKSFNRPDAQFENQQGYRHGRWMIKAALEAEPQMRDLREKGADRPLSFRDQCR